MLELIEKLREMDDGLISYGNGDYRIDTRHGQIADEIEREITELQASWEQAREKAELKREISERYMKLPVDADGVPIRLGDALYTETTTMDGCKKEDGEVVAITIGAVSSFVVLDTEDGQTIASFNHCKHKPRTIEDILFDALGDAEEGLISPNEIIAKYADELRSMGVGE